MPTHYEFAVISQQVKLGGGQPPMGWKLAHSKNFDKLTCAVYLNDKDKEAIIAFHYEWLITQDSNLTDSINNLKKFYDILPLKEVTDFITEVTNRNNFDTIIIPRRYSLSYTGYSLGAVLAELCACRDQLKAVTFESPGCKHLINNDSRFQNYSEENIIGYLAAPNYINTLYPHVGKLFRLYLPHEFIPVWKDVLATIAVPFSRMGIRLLVILATLKIYHIIFNRVYSNTDFELDTSSHEEIEKLLCIITPIAWLFSRFLTYKLGFDSPRNNLGKLIDPDVIFKNKYHDNGWIFVFIALVYIPSFFMFACLTIINFSAVIDSKNFTLNTKSEQFIPGIVQILGLFLALINIDRLGNINWTKNQHSIDNIITLFNPELGIPKKRGRVISWPTADDLDKSYNIRYEYFKFFRPYRRGLFFDDNKDRDKNLEERIKLINNYKVSENLYDIDNKNNDFFEKSLKPR